MFNVLCVIQTIKTTREMDPRPYHFEYRRPRPSNPTYESSHLYESIYHLKQNNNQNGTEQRQKSFSMQPPNQMRRANSSDLSGNKLVELENLGSYRYNSRPNIDQQAKVKQSVMASYGNNLVKNTPMDQAQIYRKQEKQFNIISFYPKEYKPSLRQFPKLTMEDRLIEKKSSLQDG